MQIISWVLAGTCILNTLIISSLLFVIYKLWDGKRKSDYEVKMNDRSSLNSPAENPKNPNEYITKDEVYENMELESVK